MRAREFLVINHWAPERPEFSTVDFHFTTPKIFRGDTCINTRNSCVGMERICVISWMITINKFRYHEVCLYAVGISNFVAWGWQSIGPLRAKPLRADKHSVIVYASKGERVQNDGSVHHCLSPFLQEKRFWNGCFSLPFWIFVSQKIWSPNRTCGGTGILIKKDRLMVGKIDIRLYIFRVCQQNPVKTTRPSSRNRQNILLLRLLSHKFTSGSFPPAMQRFSTDSWVALLSFLEAMWFAKRKCSKNVRCFIDLFLKQGTLSKQALNSRAWYTLRQGNFKNYEISKTW